MQPPPFRTIFHNIKIKNRLFLRFLQVFYRPFFAMFICRMVKFPYQLVSGGESERSISIGGLAG